MIATSSELQKSVLSALLNDKVLMGTVIDDLEPKFFSDIKYQYIFKLLQRYFKHYNELPSDAALNQLITQYHDAAFGPVPALLEAADEVMRLPIKDHAFLIDTVETFIKRSKIENVFTEVATRYESDKMFTLDDIMTELSDASAYHVNDVDCMRLDDYGEYMKRREQIFGSVDSSKIIKSFIPSINSKLTYEGYKPTDLITVVAAPGVGKTAFLINEGISAGLQGNNVLHIYLGDMNEVTAANRYMASVTNIPIHTFAHNPSEYLRMMQITPQLNAMQLFSRIYNMAFPPGEISVDKLRAIIDRLQSRHRVHFNLIIVDYADNLRAANEDMYQNGGELYNKLKAIAVNNKSVVMTASQPQRQHFGAEVIPFEGIAESAKKLHIVDVTLTIGKCMRGADIATVYLAKVREGETGHRCHLGLDLRFGRMVEITEDAYNRRRAELYADPNNKALIQNDLNANKSYSK